MRCTLVIDQFMFRIVQRLVCVTVTGQSLPFIIVTDDPSDLESQAPSDLWFLRDGS